MSLATLKAKYQQKQNTSHSQTFSLTGGRRNMSYIGKSYHKGNDVRCYNNDSNVIKPSTGTTLTLLSKINKEPNVSKEGGVLCGVGPGSKSSSEHTEELRKCIVTAVTEIYVIEKGILWANNLATSDPQLPITYTNIDHSAFSKFTLIYNNVTERYALKIQNIYINIDNIDINSLESNDHYTMIFDVNDIGYDASIFTNNIDNASMFSILRSNDSQILNHSTQDTTVTQTLNYIANDPNVYYIVIELNGASYFLAHNVSFNIISIASFTNILGKNRPNEIQQWYSTPDYVSGC